MKVVSIIKVHPRIRGEDKIFDLSLKSVKGSPPHTRGRSRIHSRNNFLIRFTPAYAGKISALDVMVDWIVVHPRIRGEDSYDVGAAAYG